MAGSGAPRATEAATGWERAAVLAAIAGVTAIAWLYLLNSRSAIDMPGMDVPMPWTVSVLLLTLAMWAVMMAGMMLPGAAPMIMTFVAINRSRRRRGEAFTPPFAFVAGYLLVWSGFALLATGAQWVLGSQGLMSAATGGRLAGALFLVAGIYQLTPLKQMCLSHCRSPFAFLLNHWRDGAAGALRMGLAHGAWCVGCCWLLMALLFALGVMNLAWVAAIAVFVMAEKVLPGGPWIARVSGAAMGAFGLALLTRLA